VQAEEFNHSSACMTHEIQYHCTYTKLVWVPTLTHENIFLVVHVEVLPMEISPGKYLPEFKTALLMFKSHISQLVSVFTITEKDLVDAGVYLKRMGY
jgi:hypothetical protein